MQLILIKHARPAVDPALPPEEWPLSDEGRAAAGKLADAIAAFKITQILHSDERKAIETANVIAAKLGVPASLADNIHEHDRGNVPHMRSGEFISHIELFFRKPGELILGRESADECSARFEEAVSGIIKQHKDQAVAVVTHGTVLSLYLSKLGAGKPFEIWRRMGLPSYAVVDTATMKVTQIVDRIA